MVYALFTNVTAGRIIHPGGPRVGHPWSKRIRLLEYASEIKQAAGSLGKIQEVQEVSNGSTAVSRLACPIRVGEV
jgi:hypothetical protein